MTDVKNYSENESWERIYNVLRGVNPNDQEGYLGQMPHNESWARIAQLLEGSLGLSFNPLNTITDEFGGMYTWTGTVTMTGITAAWTRISGSFQNGMIHSTNITPQQAQDRILIGSAGTYKIDWSISFHGSPDVEYMLEPYFGGVGAPQAAATIQPASSGSAVVASGSGFVNTSGSVASYAMMYVKPSATAWFKILSANVTVRKVNGEPY